MKCFVTEKGMGDGAIQDFVAGWFGGVTGLLVGHPFDTVKARLQTDGLDGKSLQYKGTFHCFKEITRTEGARALYKGMAAPMLGMAVINAIIFGVYNNTMKKCRPTFLNSFIAGGFAGAAQTIISCPMELVKLRMQMQKDPTAMFHLSSKNPKKLYSHPWDAVKKIFHKEGPSGHFKGMVVTLWRETIGSGVYFLTYDIVCQVFVMRRAEMTINDLGPVELCIAGGLSGIASWIACYPFDVVKSRIQVDGFISDPKYTGMVDCFKKSYRESGLRVFVKGLNSTMLRAFAVNAATFPTVVLILRHWRNE